MKTTKLSIFVMSILLLVTLVSSGAKADSTGKNKVRYDPTWESLMQHDATPQWYEDAVLGFYFHWGPYSVPAFFLFRLLDNVSEGEPDI